jgi:hypothetical protein
MSALAVGYLSISALIALASYNKDKDRMPHQTANVIASVAFGLTWPLMLVLILVDTIAWIIQELVGTNKN